MSGHVVAAAEAAARLKLETYESTFEVEAPGTGRLGVAFRDSSELWTVTPGGALHRLGVYPGCLLLRANGRPCGATDESALRRSRPRRRTATRSASCSSRGRRRRRSPASAARRGGRRRPSCYAATTAAGGARGRRGTAWMAKTVSSRPCGTTPRPSRRATCSAKLRF